MKRLKFIRDRAMTRLFFAKRALTRATDKASIAEAAAEIVEARAELERAEAALSLARSEVRT